MRLVRKNNLFVFDNFGFGDFIDSPDVSFKIDEISGVSFLDAIKIYIQKKRFADKNTYIKFKFRPLKKQHIIESIKLNNYDKYISHDVKSLCPIEKIIAKFCIKFNRKTDNWMFVIRQDEYRIRIVSGIKDFILNSRTVKIKHNNDIEKELIKTQNFINRTIHFDEIKVITNIDIPESEHFTITVFDEKKCIPSIETSVDVWEMLLRFADEYEAYEPIFGAKKKPPKKCDIYAIILFACMTAYNAYFAYNQMEIAESRYNNAQKNVKILKKSVTNIFATNDNIKKVSKAYDAISKIKSPLPDLHKIYSSGIGSCSGALKRIKWQKNQIVIDGDNICEEKINLINGKIILDSNGYQRVEVAL